MHLAGMEKALKADRLGTFSHEMLFHADEQKDEECINLILKVQYHST